jgi:hypothetical protein
MLKTVTYTNVDKATLRKKGWMLFMVVVGLQILFLAASYFLNS